MANPRESMLLTEDKLEELRNAFQTIDLDGSGHITVMELGDALKVCGFTLPGHEIRDLIQRYDTNIKDGKIDFMEFQQLYGDVKAKYDIGHTYKKNVAKATNVVTHGGTSMASSVGTTHTVKIEEQMAFSKWINSNLASDGDCRNILPLNAEGNDLYHKCSDGILLCKLINKAQPGTIDERVMNKGAKLSLFSKMENLTLALKSAQSIGCNIVNIGSDDLHKGAPHLVLGLLWQIIRIGLLADINLHDNPGLIHLLNEGETIEELMRLSPEEILIRWVNYHLANSDANRANENVRINNFGRDIENSIAYYYLIQQIAPADTRIDISGKSDGNLEHRAENMLQQAERINCRAFVRPLDVVKGNTKLNMAFVANLFNNHPALDKVTDNDLLEQIVDETREEKMYRNWMNSLGVRPFVNHLYSDLKDALVYFQLFEKIKPGSVDYSRIPSNFSKLKQKRMIEELQNCNYAVELGKQFRFSLVGIDGSNLAHASEHKSYALSLIWQLMKAYTLSVLSKLSGTDKPLAESAIVSWANQKLSKKGKTFSGFGDQRLSDGVIVIDVIDSIQSNIVNYSLVKQGSGEEEKTSNAKLAISWARKMGAGVYALPEDIVEVKQKMVMTIFACLMAAELENEQKKSTQS
ncbi:DgyrCDS9242 [Dimorphilus gyrociliatus]|uniref:DgyrCDS9242 n=2 Tax=Dimorphilus gyrociliatus TaxID=2664684 RepID=A0A7I8VY67_9ANNE|nr:DgyrCDS9242 [Dimorphilus gyrociliatus]